MKSTLLTLVIVVALFISGGLCCPPVKRLVFDLNATLEESRRLNTGYFDCPRPEADVPCFYFKHVFSPYFEIEDMVLGGSDRFLGSYTFKVVGGGPYSRKNIKYYSDEEILQFNSLRYSSQKSLVWMLEDMTGRVHLTEEGFIVMSNASNRIRWLCQRNSPCGDLTPSGLLNPDFFFTIEVSNKGINNNTDCEHTVRFELHVHGFPLYPPRALFYMLMTITTMVLLLVCYAVYICCWPSRTTDDTDEDEEEEEEQEDQSSVCDQLEADGHLMKAGQMMRSWILQLYRIFYSITQNSMFEHFVSLVVLIDVALLVAQTSQGVTERIGWFLSALEACFLAIYVMDTMLKILVLGYSYFRNPWNDLDFLIVLLNVVELILSLVDSSDVHQSSTVFRVLKTFKGARAMRAFRWLRMIRFFQTVQNVLWSFRSMGAIFALVFVFLFVFAVIFRMMFNVSDPNHFGSMPMTIFTLFQVLTLDDWSLVSMTSRDNGAPHAVYFLAAYIIVEYFTFLNLFIAVLVDNFQLTINIQKPLESQQSTDRSEDKTESPEKSTEADMSQSEIVKEFYMEALRHAFSDSEHSKRKVELITRYLDLMATMDQQQQKYRSLACLQDQLVEDFFKNIEA